MDIPKNVQQTDPKEEFAKKVLADLTAKNGYVSYYKSETPSTDIAIAVGREFVKQGYYVKVNWFVESYKGMQLIVFSTKPLEYTNARMVYSEML